MDAISPTPNHRKRRRRRGQDRPPIVAHLLLDRQLKGDVGFLSDDLYNELFPESALGTVNEKASAATELRHVAITPHTSSSPFNINTATWTIIAIQKYKQDESATKQLPPNSLQFSASSYALQTFAETLRKETSSRSIPNLRAPIGIQILDVSPLMLDTVVVNIDAARLSKHEEANQAFHYTPHWRGESTSAVGLNSYGETGRRRSTSPSKKRPALPSSRWEPVIRQTLSIPHIIHTGDMLSMPLPNHPITHRPAPPVKISLCEPVSQGLLRPDTRIAIVQSGENAEKLSSPTLSSFPPINGVVEEEKEEEDTSNEQFYSATEDTGDSTHPSPTARPSRNPTLEALDTDATSADDEDNLSDDSEETIGLNLPTLPSQASGAASAFTSATPRLGLGQRLTNGIATPGSILSAFSTSTSRGSRFNARVFEAQGLLERIPESLLLPKPSKEEDDEARVFVNTAMLAKIGCFSGDWARIESTADKHLNALSSWGLGAFDNAEEDEPDWRAVKVFALPGQFQQVRPRYVIDKTGSRRNSISSIRNEPTTPRVYLSPILLANLGGPSHLRISSLTKSTMQNPINTAFARGRITSTSLPPFAKELSLLKISTPVAFERSLQSTVFLELKNYFENKKRIVKNDDIIGIPIDETLGKALYHGNAAEEDPEQNELLSGKPPSNVEMARNASTASNIAWFKVRTVIIDTLRGESGNEMEMLWGGSAVVRPGYTTTVQAGSEQGILPKAMSSTWPYYLGIKRSLMPSSNDEEKLKDPPRQYVLPTQRRMRELISAATSPQAIHLALPPLAILLISTQRHIGKSTVAMKACADLGLNIFPIDAYEILSEGGYGGGDVKTEGFLKARAERAMTWCGAEYTALLLQHIEVLNADRMVTTMKEILAASRVLIATTTDVDKVQEGVRGLFTHELELGAPDEGEREGLLQDIIQDSGLSISASVDLPSVAVKTAALVVGDLVDVVHRAVVARSERLDDLAELANQRSTSEGSLNVFVQDILIAGGDSSRNVVKADFDIAVDAARKNFADAIGAPKIPNVSWDDVGGLSHIKDAVMETIQLPLERPELFAKGMKKRSGILFYGPPGTGKTLLAKAIATEFSLNFFSIKGPELLNMYIGESEANVRRVFQRARDARPCVVFFDELDSVAPKRGNQGDSGGVMDRIVSQLLAELDGMSNGEEGSGSGVFVIGATNRPDLLDNALLRPGRFDKMLYLGVSDTHDGQLTILEALTRKFALHPGMSLKIIAQRLPFTYTGADLYALCSDAMLKAITRRASAVDSKIKAANAKRAKEDLGPISTAYYFDHLSSPEDTEVVVEEADFDAAHRELTPSVSAKELEHYQKVKRAFEAKEPKKDEQISKIRTNVPQGPSQHTGKAKQKANGTTNDDDEFIIRTDQLSMDGASTKGANGSMNRNREVKQRTADPSFGFHNGPETDEETMYES